MMTGNGVRVFKTRRMRTQIRRGMKGMINAASSLANVDYIQE
jgi:hypothetical protein